MTFISHAQNAEDVMLWRALRHVRKGFWIDVGAADPDEMSVTRAFHDRGWTGVNVEPSQGYFDRLRERRGTDVNLKLALGAHGGSRPFFVVRDTGLSTFDAALAERHRRAGFEIAETSTEVATLADICAWHAPEVIHFLKVDAEGAEAEILAGADFARFRPWIVVMEATSPLSTEPTEQAWEPGLLACGYAFVWFDGLNRFYLAAEKSELAPLLRLPPNHLDDWMTEAERASRAEVERLASAFEQSRRAEGRALNEAAEARARVEAAFLAREAAVRERGRTEVDAAWLRRALADERARAEAREAEWQRQLEAVRAERRPDKVDVEPQAVVPVVPDPVAIETALLPAPQPALWRKLAVRFGYQPIRPIVRPIAWRLRTFMTAELRSDLRVLLDVVREARPTDVLVERLVEEDLAQPEAAALRTPVVEPEPQPEPEQTAPALPRLIVHQYHASVATRDAISNGMFVTRDLLRARGFESQIFARHPVGLADVLPAEDLPEHDHYVLLVHHSFHDPDAERIASLTAPKILVYHNITPPHLLGHSGLKAAAEAGLAQLSFWRTRVVAAVGISDFNSLELCRRGFQVVRTCPLVLDADRLRARAARPGRMDADATGVLTILFVGRIVKSKGQAELVDAFAAFRRLYTSESRLVLVGRVFEGEEAYEAEVRGRIRGQGLASHVVLTGSVDDDTLHDWYRRADLYASMSAHEGFAVPLVEAMAYGLPVVALAAGAVPMTLGGAGVAVRDGEELARTLALLASSRSRAEAIAREGTARFEALAARGQWPVLSEVLALAGAARRVDLEPIHPGSSLMVTVAGHVNGSYSLASVNRTLAFALEGSLGEYAGLLPVEGAPGAVLADRYSPSGVRLAAMAARAAAWTGPRAVISQHYPVWVPPEDAQWCAAYLFWEESLLPDETVTLLNERFGAVLAPSRSVRHALIASGVTVPIRIVGFAPPLEAFAALADRPERVGDRPFTFLHVSSAFPRKGLDVLLDAWVTAFGSDERVRLVIKTFPNPHNDSLARITELRARHPNTAEIVHLDEELSEDDLHVLYLGADAVVLPSRGEGFNIPAAEAMAAGVPLIVSAVGGHRDFVGPDEALLIEGRYAPSATHLATDGSIWFEPDRDALVAAMREVVDRRDEAAARAMRARAAVASRLGTEDFGRRVVTSISELIGSGRKPKLSRIAMMTSWGVRCGIAEYAAMLRSALAAAGISSVVIADGRAVEAVDVRPAWMAGPPFDPAETARAVARIDPAVLLIQHQPGLFGWTHLACLLEDRRVSDRATAVTLHNTRDLDGLAREDRDRVREALARVTCIVHTTADLDRLRSLGLEDAHVIAQGVLLDGADAPATRTLLARDAPVIGTYGFILPPKNFEALIRAVPILRERWPQLRLRMVTALYDADISRREHGRLLALADELGVGSAIEWHTDFLPNEDSLRLLRGCDLLVLPYTPTGEASSAALRIALASLVPVAVTPISLFKEAEGATALLSGDTPGEVAADIMALLQDDDRRRALPSAQEAWLRPRAWSAIGRRTAGLLAALSAQRGV